MLPKKFRFCAVVKGVKWSFPNQSISQISQFFQTWKAFYLETKSCLRFYYNSRSFESFATIRGSIYEVFQSRFEFGKNNVCSTIGRKILNHLVQLKYFKFPCYFIYSGNKFGDFLLNDGPGKPDFLVFPEYVISVSF